MCRGDVLAGVLRTMRGHVPELLRHPYAAAIVDDLYLCANGQQRNAMVAEFYAREYVLFEQVCIQSIPQQVCNLPVHTDNPSRGHSFSGRTNG